MANCYTYVSMPLKTFACHLCTVNSLASLTRRCIGFTRDQHLQRRQLWNDPFTPQSPVRFKFRNKLLFQLKVIKNMLYNIMRLWTVLCVWAMKSRLGHFYSPRALGNSWIGDTLRPSFGTGHVVLFLCDAYSFVVFNSYASCLLLCGPSDRGTVNGAT